MCSEPERACRHFASTVTQGGWLLCPRARQRCDGGGSTWPQRGFDRQIEAGIERVRERYPGELDDERRTLIGFSLGAFRALDLAHDARGRYPRVILIGARIYPDAERLRAAGVERLLLAAGDWDMMRGHMEGRTRALVRRGFPAAFQRYGAVGHAFPADFPRLLQRGLAWIGGDDGALEPGT
jgi:pimeloyl-ACP methyl ester carboxylesterase